MTSAESKVETRQRVTYADILRHEAEIEDGYRVEVENGEIIEVERDMTWLHLFVIQNLYDLLKPFVVLHHLGFVFMDGGRYYLAGTVEDVQRAYVPDLSFIRTARIPEPHEWSGDFPGAPDLVVEVASPGQVNASLLKRVARYLEAGSEEAWLIYPKREVLYRFRRDDDMPILHQGADEIDLSPLFPGLTLKLSEMFAKPKA